MSIAQFDHQGLAVIVSFSSKTNLGNLPIVFLCSNIFDFVEMGTAICTWLDASTIKITSSGRGTLLVNDTISLKANSGIKALCPSGTSLSRCSSWSDVMPEVLSIQGPAVPILPVIFAPCGLVASYCKPLVFDLMTATGSCGRDWYVREVLVDSLEKSNLEAINSLFRSSESLRVVIPESSLSPLTKYQFSIKLCNFLNFCSQYSHIVEITSSSFPMVSLPFESTSLRSSSQLLIRSKASFVECGKGNTAQPIFSWSISNGDTVMTIKSISADPSLFKLRPSTLKSGTTYSITCLVSYGSLSSQPVTVLVTVLPPLLTARISDGRPSFFLKSSTEVTLDGSQSWYDDGSSISGVRYTWTCVQTAPISSLVCDSLMLTSLNKTSLVLKRNLSTPASTLIGNEYTVTLTISDGDQQSISSVSVFVLEDAAPTVLLMSSRPIINPSEILQIRSTVSTLTSQSLSWSVDSPDISPFLPQTTPLSTPGTYSGYVIFAAHSLPSRSTPYTFSITCGNSKTTVSVLVNSPPSAGTFLTTPSHGIELDSIFLSVAQQWIDNDLPLTYQFGYVTPSGHLMTTRIRSESPVSNQYLPSGGKEDDHRIFCYARIFDSLLATVTVHSNVTVSPDGSAMDAASAQSKLEMIGLSGEIDETRNMLSAIGTRVTSKSCTFAPNCTLLNRESCSDVEDTCGSCLLNFIGQTGSHNSLCVDLNQQISSTSAVVSCDSDSACADLQICNLESNSCEPISKSCPNNCSNQGICKFLSVDSDDIEMLTCKVGDPYCSPVCVCFDGFGGAICEYDETHLDQQTEIMTVLVDSLSNLMRSDDTSEENMMSWQSNLFTFTRDPSILTNASLVSALEISSMIMSSAATLSSVVTPSQMNEVVSSLDSILSAQPSSIGVCQESLDILAAMAASSSMMGQSAEEFVYSNFRYVSSVNSFSGAEDSKIEVTSPRTVEDAYGGRPMNSVEIFSEPSSNRRQLQLGAAGDGNGNAVEEEQKLKIVLMQMKSGLFSRSLDTNPLRLYLTGSGYGNLSFTFHNFLNRSYSESALSQLQGEKERFVFNTTCEMGIEKQESFVCSEETDEGKSPPVILQHNCSGGVSEILSTPCPSIKKVPSCVVMEGDAECFVSNYSESFTTCTCRLSSHRRLNTIESMSLQVISSVSYISDGFGETISSPMAINSPEDLSRVLIVIFLYGILWVGGFSLLGLCAFRSYHTKRDVDPLAKARQGKLEREASGAGDTNVNLSIAQNRLLHYVNTIIPSVYNNQNWMTRMLEELSKHHRYLILFMVNDEVITESRRMLTGIQLLTVQAMLMFLLAVACDIQFPMDDGSCVRYDTQEDCLRTKSHVDLLLHLAGE
jgi:hypothetical protein